MRHQTFFMMCALFCSLIAVIYIYYICTSVELFFNDKVEQKANFLKPKLCKAFDRQDVKNECIINKLLQSHRLRNFQDSDKCYINSNDPVFQEISCNESKIFKDNPMFFNIKEEKTREIGELLNKNLCMFNINENNINQTNIRKFADALRKEETNCVKKGLYFYIYHGYYNYNVKFFEGKTPFKQGITNDFTDLNNATKGLFNGKWSNKSIQWRGYFEPQKTGEHTFFIGSDNASFLFMGLDAKTGLSTDYALVDNGGKHEFQTKSASIKLFKQTKYPICIIYGKNESGEKFFFSFKEPSNENQIYSDYHGVYYTQGAQFHETQRTPQEKQRRKDKINSKLEKQNEKLEQEFQQKQKELKQKMEKQKQEFQRKRKQKLEKQKQNLKQEFKRERKQKLEKQKKKLEQKLEQEFQQEQKELKQSMKKKIKNIRKQQKPSEKTPKPKLVGIKGGNAASAGSDLPSGKIYYCAEGEIDATYRVRFMEENKQKSDPADLTLTIKSYGYKQPRIRAKFDKAMTGEAILEAKSNDSNDNYKQIASTTMKNHYQVFFGCPSID